MALPAGTGVVAYNAAISRCARAGLYARALALFREMRGRGLRADEYTLPPLLNSAALLRGPPGAVAALHALLLRAGLAHHLHVANALVDAYARLPCAGGAATARAVFDEMPRRDVVTWTSLLTGLARAGAHAAAVRAYHGMVAAGVQTDEFAVAAVLSSCAGSTALDVGRSVHAAAVHLGLCPFRSVGNSLVSMYAKTGALHDARAVFDAMPARCTITWTALIVGYAQNGRGRRSLEVYTDMVRSGCRPDYVTFIGLLFACSHAGLVDAGRDHFRSMAVDYGIAPGPDHYACMVDMLGRAGRLEEAEELMLQMPSGPSVSALQSLLGACRIHGNTDVGERVASVLTETEPTESGAYVLLSNIYAEKGDWGAVARVRRQMRERGVKKEVGFSWVDAGGAGDSLHLYKFSSDDTTHPQSEEIYRVAEGLGWEMKFLKNCLRVEMECPV